MQNPTQLVGESGHLCILSRSASIRVVFTPPRASAASSCSAARTSWLNCSCITCAYVTHISTVRQSTRGSTSGTVVSGSCAAGWIVEGCRTVSASPHLLCRKVLRPRRHRRVPRLRPYRRQEHTCRPRRPWPRVRVDRVDEAQRRRGGARTARAAARTRASRTVGASSRRSSSSPSTATIKKAD